MKLFSITFLLFVFCIANHIYAQNPRQTSMYRSKATKAKQKHEPYEYKPNSHDRDSDGVSDYTDKCPDTPKGEKVTTFGCPFDTDFDGLLDTEDSCVTEAGPRENKGCPYKDTDGDGITDNLDKCPTIAGLKIFEGCPDTDGDGVQDSEDRCPSVAGVKKYFGCPPTDYDKDGVIDDEDVCPKTPGVVSNRGCPEIKPADKAALQKAFENLLFETGSDVIISSSYPSLNGLAGVLNNNNTYQLHLEGHTDNVGEDQSNMLLSQKRAISTKAYLVGMGINDSRITADGFGETRPKASNDEEGGRKLNRRVEMVLITGK